MDGILINSSLRQLGRSLKSAIRLGADDLHGYRIQQENSRAQQDGPISIR